MSSQLAVDGDIIDDPIQYFLEDQEFHGKAERTLRAYDRVLNQFHSFVQSHRSTDIDLTDVTRRDCLEWVHGLRSEYSPSTIATYTSYVNRFYGYMVQIGAFDRNPMAVVMEEMSESIETNPTRRDISIPRMREFVSSINHPLDRAIVITFLKTGIRVGELCNLDIQDIHLSALGQEWQSLSVRPGLEEQPDSMYISHEPTYNRVYNGEIRSASNKRMRDTIIPVDDELAHALLTWLQIRPDAISSAQPLFLNTRDNWGYRLDPDDVGYRIRQYTSNFGWYEPGNSAAENVTPHYFRHFFTTNMRDRIGDRGVVKYIRGDVADDIIDTYTHNWGNRVREVYLENIYRCFDG